MMMLSLGAGFPFATTKAPIVRSVSKHNRHIERCVTHYTVNEADEVVTRERCVGVLLQRVGSKLLEATHP